MSHPYLDVPTPTVIGHRGAAGSAPENTLESFALGLELGAHILESDIHQTRDGVPVLMHDNSTARMTGGDADVCDLDFAELRELDASFGFVSRANKENEATFEGLRIPSVREAFERFPRERFNFEIKAEDIGLVEAVFALIAEFDRADLTLLAAEKDEVMGRIHAEAKRTGVHPAIGASVGDVLAHVRAAIANEPPASDAMALQIPVEFGGRTLITPELLKHAHQHGTVVHAWTINEPDEMRRLLDLGVDGLITDHPERMRDLLATD
ncbi:MAG: glycerophosphodiester phosphodiesterase [Myxococcota bacterium]|nr:glycerophosphodiester phosphodiesterase [Myxococcota bacterium]